MCKTCHLPAILFQLSIFRFCAIRFCHWASNYNVLPTIRKLYLWCSHKVSSRKDSQRQPGFEWKGAKYPRALFEHPLFLPPLSLTPSNKSSNTCISLICCIAFEQGHRESTRASCPLFSSNDLKVVYTWVFPHSGYPQVKKAAWEATQAYSLLLAEWSMPRLAP
jgi:hypothetical protein